MRRLVVSLVLAVAAAQPQAPRPKPAAPNYAKGVNRGSEQIRLLQDDDHEVRFVLITSWIPGPKKEGLFRYQLFGDVVSGSGTFSADWSLPKFVDRIHDCIYQLDIKDEGGFILARVSVIMQRTMGDNGQPVGIASNDIEPMSLDSYQSFLRASPSRSWEIGWTCK